MRARRCRPLRTLPAAKDYLEQHGVVAVVIPWSPTVRQRPTVRAHPRAMHEAKPGHTSQLQTLSMVSTLYAVAPAAAAG